jgi:hypothetical protein
MDNASTTVMQLDEGVNEASQWAGAFLAGFKSAQTRRAYRRDLHCWFTFCTAHHLHPFRGVRRTHLELYLRELELLDPTPAPGTLYRRVATLSSWFRWLEDEGVTIGNPAGRIRRPQRHSRPQPWLNRNELTDLLTAAEDEGGDAYALVCLLGLNGLRVSEASLRAASRNSHVGPPTALQWPARIVHRGVDPARPLSHPRRCTKPRRREGRSRSRSLASRACRTRAGAPAGRQDPTKSADILCRSTRRGPHWRSTHEGEGSQSSQYGRARSGNIGKWLRFRVRSCASSSVRWQR